MGSDSGKKRQSSAKRGGRAARSTAEWWNSARTAAFEALRRGEKPDVPRRTLEGWQAAPQWQAKLAKREAKREANAAEREAERDRLLEDGCDGAIRAWKAIVSDATQSPFARITAGQQLWALKLKRDEKAQQHAQKRIWDITFTAEVWVE